MEKTRQEIGGTKGNAYVTLLSSMSYIPGVLVLHRSLKAAGAGYPLYCMISMSVDEDAVRILEREGIACIRLGQAAVSAAVNDDDEKFSHWNSTFDKLFVWGLTQFRKIVFLDSDMLVIGNIDSLFEKEPFSAVSADSSYPGNEGWAGGLNSGLMVICPDIDMKERMFAAIRPAVSACRQQGRSAGDQDVIKYVLRDWGNRTELHLDEGYNLFADHLSYYIGRLGYSLCQGKGRQAHVIHFIGKSKPWMKKSFRTCIWILRMFLKDPYYFRMYRLYRSYLRDEVRDNG